MDASNTQQIPRRVVDRIDAEPDPDTTTKLPSSLIEANDVAAWGEAPGERDSHLATAQPTTPLTRPTAGSVPTAESVSAPESGRGPESGSTTGPVPTAGPGTEAGEAHPRTEPLPTGPAVDQPNSGQLHPEDLPRHDHGASGPPTDPVRAQQGESRGGDGGDGTDGLVPTVRAEEGQSYLSRRLDGL
ncbi:hypothetical protein [Saccharomonospora saliphila]|uniref:hypothetical protein n=1 Tax=Saccharomonospora saliphila TaxID=369829 RepID=UPI0038CD2E8E